MPTFRIAAIELSALQEIKSASRRVSWAYGLAINFLQPTLEHHCDERFIIKHKNPRHTQAPDGTYLAAVKAASRPHLLPVHIDWVGRCR